MRSFTVKVKGRVRHLNTNAESRITGEHVGVSGRDPDAHLGGGIAVPPHFSHKLSSLSNPMYWIRSSDLGALASTVTLSLERPAAVGAAANRSNENGAEAAALADCRRAGETLLRLARDAPPQRGSGPLHANEP